MGSPYEAYFKFIRVGEMFEVRENKEHYRRLYALVPKEGAWAVPNDSLPVPKGIYLLDIDLHNNLLARSIENLDNSGIPRSTWRRALPNPDNTYNQHFSKVCALLHIQINLW